MVYLKVRSVAQYYEEAYIAAISVLDQIDAELMQ